MNGISWWFVLVICFGCRVALAEPRLISEIPWTPEQKISLKSHLLNLKAAADDGDQQIQDLQAEPFVVGAFFTCNPFCAKKVFLWGPAYILDLKNEELASLRYLDRQDPAFEKIFGALDLNDAELLAEKEKQKGFRGEILSHLVRIQEEKRDKSLFFLSYLAGLKYEKNEFTTNTNLQTFLPSEAAFGYSFGLLVVPNIRYRFKKGFLFPMLSYVSGAALDRKSSVNAEKIQSSSTSILAGLRYAKDSWYVDLGFFQLQDKVGFSSERIEGYTMTLQPQGLNFGVGWRAWQLNFSQSLIFDMSENQGYRTNPFSGSYSSYELRYCFTSKTSPGSILELCPELSYIDTKQNATLASNISSAQRESVFQEKRTLLSLKISYGENFMERIR